MFNSYRDDLATALRAIHQERVQDVAGILRRAQFQNASVYILGNGGSAATASHFSNDLLKMCGIRAFALTDLAPVVSAYGNDTGWNQMFAGPLRAMILPQDVVIAISCSGNSPNVVEAVKMVKNISLPAVRTIVLTGADVNCQLAQCIPDAIVYVPFKDIRIQEDCHLAICHALAGELKLASAQAN